MSKRTKLMGISLISCLLLLSSINVSNAQPTWVGVSAGESFTYKITMYGPPTLDLLEDLNLTYGMPPEYSTLFVGSESINLKVNVKYVSNELDYAGIKYANISCTLSLVFPGTTTFEDIESFNHMIVKFKDNYTGAIQDLVMGGYFDVMGIFLPTNMNWTKFVDEINLLLSAIPEIPGTITITALSNGINVNYPGGYFEIPGLVNGTIGAVDATVKYNTNGVLSSVVIKYGGATLATVGFAQAEIFGYELSIVLVISTAAVIGLIYYIRRKKRIV